METFILLTRLSHGALRDPDSLLQLERQVRDRIERECPQVVWLGNYAVLGPYDYLDIFQVPGTEQALKVATLIRTFGHAQTEVWPATQWSRYKELLTELSPGHGAK